MVATVSSALLIGLGAAPLTAEVPTLPPNRIVADIDLAPRNTNREVEFSSECFLIKPERIERGNGAVLYEVSNRRGTGRLGMF